MTPAVVELPPLCDSGKRGYATAAVATAAMSRIGRPRSGKGGKRPNRVYLCKLCDQWHLTARNGKGNRS